MRRVKKSIRSDAKKSLTAFQRQINEAVDAAYRRGYKDALVQCATNLLKTHSLVLRAGVDAHPALARTFDVKAETLALAARGVGEYEVPTTAPDFLKHTR